MIDEEKFIKLITEYQKFNDLIDQASDIFPCFFESQIVNIPCRLFEELIKCHFDEVGVDRIDYYLYENPDHCYYDNGELIPFKTVSDLWNTVKDCRI